MLLAKRISHQSVYAADRTELQMGSQFLDSEVTITHFNHTHDAIIKRIIKKNKAGPGSVEIQIT